MNYDRYYTYDMVNGPGLRVTLFVTGCVHACPGCHNESLWDRKAGKPFTAEVQEELLQACADHDGLSLSGGDPLHPANRDAILALCQAFKARYPEKNIWLWTGYTLREVEQLQNLKYIDTLIDGRYEAANTSRLPWRGSSNQHLISPIQS
ncbi:anaerobic ribonucleoside-triphosphate reductase activating protein [Chitinibacter sp. ZOR0017]|uniref:anaerobic ribonucleoside-triphosphate reductase activating protein n=1 Tax=Chitinibacter sp. ZOR0017 TaxID=1339254 RepID=UPI000646306C|nr:anaerobic ribonucleoside-triphosphate reductase activating protein [Chitinibacter sp. ZOR0017]